MRPAHVYANVSDEQYHQLVDVLHRQWRVATRTVMILLSAGGMPAADIAALLHYDPATVRRGSPATISKVSVDCPTGPAPAGPGWVVGTWATGSDDC